PRGREGAVCRGLDITLHFDEDHFTGNGVYLFGAILERFFGMYCAINSFTRTAVTTTRRDGKVCEWPARSADLVFLRGAASACWPTPAPALFSAPTRVHRSRRCCATRIRSSSSRRFA